MSEKSDEKSNKKVKKDNDDQDPPKPHSTDTPKPDDKKEEDDDKERTLEQIENELDELRPKPPSPKTKRRIEEKQEKKDQQSSGKHPEEESSLPMEVKKDEEGEIQHKDNELTPGKPDPTITDNVKIPVLNERGDVELKPQQGSALNRKTNNNDTQSTDETEQKKE